MDAVDVTDEVVAGVENLLRFLDDVVLGVIFVLDRFVPEDEEANEDNEDGVVLLLLLRDGVTIGSSGTYSSSGSSSLGMNSSSESESTILRRFVSSSPAA